MICSASHQKKIYPCSQLEYFLCESQNSLPSRHSNQFSSKLTWSTFLCEKKVCPCWMNQSLWFAYGCLWLPTLLVASVRVARLPPRPPCSPLGARRGLTKLRGAHSRYSPSGPWMALGGAPPSATHQTISIFALLFTLSAVATFMNIEASWWFSELSKRSHILRMKKISKRFAASKCFLNSFSSVSVDCACEATSKTILTQSSWEFAKNMLWTLNCIIRAVSQSTFSGSPDKSY